MQRKRRHAENETGPDCDPAGGRPPSGVAGARRATAQLQDAAGRSEALIGEFEQERLALQSALADARVALLFGDKAAAPVADHKARLEALEAGLTAAREQLAIEQQAVHTIDQRGAVLRGRLGDELRDEVDETHRELCTEFAEHLQALQPTGQALRELRSAHPSAFETSRVPMLNELIVRLPDSKAAAWVREVRALGIDVSA